MESDKPIVIKYVFRKEDDSEYIYRIELNPENFELLYKKSPPKKEWTQLGFQQCKVCPLTTKDCEHCPAAQGLASFITDFSGELSHERTKVACITEERTYYRSTDLQSGIYSLMGLILATSGCPIFNFLKPMARFHLPFSSTDETLVRSLSFYLMKRFFEQKDTSLADLDIAYKNVNSCNKSLLERIRRVSKKDANPNALVLLDAFRTMTEFAITNAFDEVRKIALPPDTYAQDS